MLKIKGNVMLTINNINNIVIHNFVSDKFQTVESRIKNVLPKP